jgi:hypothetical protein
MDLMATVSGVVVNLATKIKPLPAGGNSVADPKSPHFFYDQAAMYQKKDNLKTQVFYKDDAEQAERQLPSQVQF